MNRRGSGRYAINARLTLEGESKWADHPTDVMVDDSRNIAIDKFADDKTFHDFLHA